MSDSLWPHVLKHARLPCPLLSPRVQHFLYKLYDSIFELFFWLCEHYFASGWDEYNCAVIWMFFGIAFLWDWNENWPSPVLWPLLSIPNLLTYWVQYFHSIIIIGIPSPPLALFVECFLRPIWLHIPGCLALGEWSHHHEYLGH